MNCLEGKDGGISSMFNVRFLLRYKDQIFFTWNGTKEKLNTFLQAYRQQHSNVHLQISIAFNVQFLHAYIENQNGQLYTRVYHHPALHNYTLPYVIGHPKYEYSDWFRSALIRAICYCSLVEDFHRERIYLEMSLLANGYSLLFIETHLHHFFNYLNTNSIQYSLDQTKYHSWRCQWLEYTEKQYDMANKLQQLNDQGRLSRFHYLYQYGPRCQFSQQFHQLWTNCFSQHPVLSNDKSKVILTTKHPYSLNTLLDRHKSSHFIQ